MKRYRCNGCGRFVEYDAEQEEAWCMDCGREAHEEEAGEAPRQCADCRLLAAAPGDVVCEGCRSGRARAEEYGL